MKLETIAMALVGTIILSGCVGPVHSHDGRTVVTLTIQPTDNPTKIADKAGALEAYLENATGFDIRIHTPLSNSGVIEALMFGFADVAMLSAWPSLLASQKAGAEIGLAEKREVMIGNETQVQPYYFSYYVVLRDSPIQTLADLRGKRVAFPSATSTSGYVFPMAQLVDTGLAAKPASGEIDPKAFFGSVLFAGGYRQGWEALKQGQVDATVIAGDVPAALYREVLNATRVIATQGPVPSHGVVFRSGLAAPVRLAMEDAFLGLKGERQELMRGLVSAIFVEFHRTNTTQHTQALHAALQKIGLPFQERLS